MDKSLKIGIAGVGFVGGAVKHYFEQTGVELFLYDPGKGLGSVEELNKADIVFICVPTPFEKGGEGFNLSYVEDAVNKVGGEKIIVIKSTVPPGTTQYFQEKHPQHKFLFNPEFLVESRAIEDMMSPDRQLVGYTEKSQAVAQKVLDILPKAPFTKLLDSSEAEMVKYFGNTFLAVKVIFGVEMYKLCQKLGIDYEVVRECASKDPRIGPSHLDVHFGSYLGYGGKCLPKDIRALIEMADKNGVDLQLHKKTEELNNKLMEQQGIDDPEKFSKRE